MPRDRYWFSRFVAQSGCKAINRRECVQVHFTGLCVEIKSIHTSVFFVVVFSSQWELGSMKATRSTWVSTPFLLPWNDQQVRSIEDDTITTRDQSLQKVSWNERSQTLIRGGDPCLLLAHLFFCSFEETKKNDGGGSEVSSRRRRSFFFCFFFVVCLSPLLAGETESERKIKTKENGNVKNASAWLCWHGNPIATSGRRCRIRLFSFLTFSTAHSKPNRKKNKKQNGLSPRRHRIDEGVNKGRPSVFISSFSFSLLSSSVRRIERKKRSPCPLPSFFCVCV